MKPSQMKIVVLLGAIFSLFGGYYVTKMIVESYQIRYQRISKLQKKVNQLKTTWEKVDEDLNLHHQAIQKTLLPSTAANQYEFWLTELCEKDCQMEEPDDQTR